MVNRLAIYMGSRFVIELHCLYSSSTPQNHTCSGKSLYTGSEVTSWASWVLNINRWLLKLYDIPIQTVTSNFVFIKLSILILTTLGEQETLMSQMMYWWNKTRGKQLIDYFLTLSTLHLGSVQWLPMGNFIVSHFCWK